MTKWIEAGVVDRPNLTSEWVTNWFHCNITCRFGVPAAVRCDRGREYRGAFQIYCDSMGIRVQLISTAHPRANGLVERYNGVIESGFRKLSAACPGG
jgi:hypothetical protein